MNEKMVSLGRLAGAVAHEINNPLGGILAFTQIMLREIPKGTDHFNYLELVEDSTRRCQKTVCNLLDYARFYPMEERQIISLEEVILKSVRLVEHRLQMNSTKVSVRSVAGPKLVRVNSNLIQQVFVNLLNNANDAMEKGGLVLVVIEPSTSVDRWVQAKVIDEGEGIEENSLGKIFEPFYTTKEVGKGTGLGLSISYQVVKDNGGTLEVESAPGSGTTFTLSFPAAPDSAAEAKQDRNTK